MGLYGIIYFNYFDYDVSCELSLGELKRCIKTIIIISCLKYYVFLNKKIQTIPKYINKFPLAHGRVATAEVHCQ